MARKRVTVEQWITQALADTDKGGPCSGMSLVYIKQVGHEEIHTKQFSGQTQDASQLAQFFIDRATGYAQDLPGLQTFRLLAFYGKQEPQASFPFTVSDGELTAGGDIPWAKHEPTQAGLLGQLMKHNEQLVAMAISITQTTAVAAIQREEAMRKEVAEAQLIVRDVIFNMRKETHEMHMAQLQFQRSTQERQMLGKAIPSIINHLAGRDVMPEEMADTALIDAMAMKVKPEHLQQLAQFGVIPAEMLPLLAARFQKAHEKRQAEEQALRSLPPENSENKVS